MKIKTLQLSNFQGIKSMTIDANGGSLNIYGANGTGKTTVANAFSWLLTGNAAAEVANYSPKTRNEQGVEIHFLDHAVEGVFLHNGYEVTLKRVLHENWQKKKGSNTEQFAGNTTDYYVDGVPVKQKEYDARINELFPQNMTKIFSSPLYFSGVLHWEDRRKILLDVCGDVSDDDVFSANPHLSDLQPKLGRNTVDDLKKISAEKMKLINKEIEEIPARIDEVNRNIPNITEEMHTSAQSDRLKSQFELDLQRKALEVTQNGTDGAEHRKRIAEIDGQILSLKNEGEEKLQEARAAKDDAEQPFVDRISSARSKIRNLKSLVMDAESKANSLRVKRNNLVAAYKEQEDQTYSNDGICPTCKQPLPKEEIEQRIAAFNARKAQTLEDIRGRLAQEASKEMIESMESEKNHMLAKIQELEQEIEHNQNVLNGGPQPATLETFLDQESIDRLQAEKNEITALLNNDKAAVNSKVEQINAEIARYQNMVDEAEAVIARYAAIATMKERIKDLTAREKELAVLYEAEQETLFQCEEFTRAKVFMLDEKINNKFATVSFRLFKEFQNGGIAETCDALCKTSTGLQEWSVANNAAKINAGIEIISTLAEHYKVEMPVFIDNAEAVSNIIPTDLQIIRLIVSENDEKIRIEEGIK